MEKSFEQGETKSVNLISEERLREILSILLPYGYSHYKGHCKGPGGMYTGVSPYIGDEMNVITILANDPKGCVFEICMERFDEESDENDSLGFYKGIMKLIAPELNSTEAKFKREHVVLAFNLASDRVQDNRFPVKVVPNPL